MRSLFGSKEKSGSERGAERVPRYSSGWKELLKHLGSEESLRILDIGPTSSTNINFITGLGHSIYMANLVDEASKPEWVTTESDQAPTFDVSRFLAANLNFSGRMFDVVIFWDTADYLPAPLLAPLFDRLYEVMQPGGHLLAFFHAKPAGAADPVDRGFMRYHLTASDLIEMQAAGKFPLVNTYNNRQIETLLKRFRTFRFFLAKDNLREVIATR